MLFTYPREDQVCAVSQVLQAETQNARPLAAFPAWRPVLQVAVLGGLSLWLYASTLVRLVAQWRHDPNFSHGFLVPLFSAFVVWQERPKLACLKRRPSWSGILILVMGLCLLLLGQMGAELFLSRISLLFVLAGMIVFFLGWNFFQALLFPWALLLLMIPIPAIIFNQITFPLQLLASKIASAILPWLGVPVLREGNVIVLPGKALEVADACSGIRSLMSLATIAVIYGYLVERRLVPRVLLALASLPIAVAANSLRVVITGLLVQYWDPDKAEGFFHEFQGWLMFVASLFMLYILHRVVRVFWPEGNTKSSSSPISVSSFTSPIGSDRVTRQLRSLYFVIVALLIASAALALQFRGSLENVPSDQLSSFPKQIGNWVGSDLQLDEATLDTLGHPHYLLRVYRDPAGKLPTVDLFIPYFSSQRTGDTLHSPQNCFPGSGWTAEENRRITLSVAGQSPFPANRYVIVRAGARALVLYWYWAHARGVASEYWAKYYLVKDSILMNRSDGALIRLVIPMFSGESAEEAEQRLSPFTDSIVPLLNDYIPR